MRKSRFSEEQIVGGQVTTYMKLSFLIAGVQKGATSALHHYLRQHPDLYLPAKKELHFFDNENIDWSAPP